CPRVFGAPPCCPDVFVHDRLTGVTERVIVASDGTEGNCPSGGVISADGRFVAFNSSAPPLVSGILVREPDSTDRSADFNGDGDTGDTVVQVYPVTAPSGTAWTNVGQAADTVDVAGSVVAFITLEAAQGHQDLNGDGDTTDRVLQVYDADAGTLLVGQGAAVRPQAAEDFVVGGEPGRELVAFRTRECAQHGSVVSAKCPGGEPTSTAT